MAKFTLCLFILFPFTLWSQSPNKKNELRVAVFLSADCPISQKYLKTLDTLYRKYSDELITWSFILPGHNRKEVKKFIKEFDVTLPLIADRKFKYTKSFAALTTPEAVVQVKGETLYRGAIDNWFYALGKYRLKVTEHFLDDALKNYFSGSKIDPEKTEAVGCPIPKYQ